VYVGSKNSVDGVLRLEGAHTSFDSNPQVTGDGVIGVVAACASSVSAAVSTILIGLLLQRFCCFRFRVTSMLVAEFSNDDRSIYTHDVGTESTQQ
jgi:uncharacterized membrane protein